MDDAVQRTGERAARAAAGALREAGAREVYLFGSFARSRADGESDLDLAVEGLDPRRFFFALARAADAAGRPVDLVDLDEDTPFTRYLRRSGTLRRVG